MLRFFLAEAINSGAVAYVSAGFEYVHKGYSFVETVEVFALAKKVVVAVATVHAVKSIFVRSKCKKSKRNRSRRPSKGNSLPHDCGRLFPMLQAC